MKNAYLISVVFHPLLLCTYVLAVLYAFMPQLLLTQDYPTNTKLLLIGFIFLYTAALPALFVWLLYRNNKISNLELSQLKERRLPYFITFIVYSGFAYFLIKKGGVLHTTGIVIAIIAVTILAAALISLFWQISAHQIAFGGVLGILFALIYKYNSEELFLTFYGCLILSGVVASARLKLNAHTVLQVALGTLTGFIIGYLGTLLYV